MNKQIRSALSKIFGPTLGIIGGMMLEFVLEHALRKREKWEFGIK